MTSKKQVVQETLDEAQGFIKKLWKDLEPKNTLNTSFFISRDAHKSFRYLTLIINTIMFIWTLAVTGTGSSPTYFHLLQFLTIWGLTVCYLYSILVIVWQDAPDHSDKWKFAYLLGEIGFAMQLLICPFFFAVLFPDMLTDPELNMGPVDIAYSILIHGLVPVLIWLETFFNGATFHKSHRVVLNWTIVAYLLNNLAWTVLRQKPVYPPVNWVTPFSYILSVVATLAVIGGFILGGKIYVWKKDKYLHRSNNLNLQQTKSS